jgi:hypothetical protein
MKFTKNIVVPMLGFLILSSGAYADPGVLPAGCPGCCSSHGGITNACFSDGRVYCADGSVSPTCLCSTCGISVAPPPPVAITPQLGLWWNPAESGSGYAIDFKHGVLVMTVYSYTQSGEPIWYLVAGSIVNNAATLTLDKYQGGQCISCAYRVNQFMGNDGVVTITITSTTSATLNLPGGRTVQIVPQAF